MQHSSEYFINKSSKILREIVNILLYNKGYKCTEVSETSDFS